MYKMIGNILQKKKKNQTNSAKLNEKKTFFDMYIVHF